MAGFHEQAIFDATCQHTVLQPPMTSAGVNVTPHNMEPVYDMNRVLLLLRTCAQTDRYAFYVKAAHEHNVKVLITSLGSVHAALIEHIFSGACVLNEGSGCKEVVSNEKWPPAMGIAIIDAVLKWMEQGILSMEEFTHMCGVLGMASDSKQQRRSLIIKLHWGQGSVY